jgi:hypothetical protein
VQPVVLQLDNGYEDVVATGSARRPAELFVPLQSAASAVSNNAQTARQQLAVLGSQLRQRAGCAAAPNLPTYLQVYPQSHPGTEAPLGWALSQDSREDMKGQLGNPANQCTLLALRYWMTGSAGPGRCVEGTVSGADGLAAGNQIVCLPGADGAVTKVRTNAFGVFVHTEPALVPDPTPLTSGEGCEETALVAGPRFGEGAQLALGYELSAVGQAELPSSGWSPFAVAVTVVLAGAGLWAALEPLRRRVDARTAPVSPGSSRSSDSA